ncbi:hypothetical protein P175DRAFT_0500890 [Aspergillus ochraceoroseus IBT 24754]|uniref:Secreted protein n=1 Tax=Aspergillus ochraceoroseus IBT 24754 TaxID=1392256 RepID=A0A2T5M0H4_9EURO|nr:uncharacterized protein P175DRAFT_0500890 [Aspergillus ochraceoroseus IBT 24754]PTU22035.1 hypothetical protein P175DRAFT_0500890 [Aspergillus ochraceoroseus IBT 24754]
MRLLTLLSIALQAGLLVQASPLAESSASDVENIEARGILQERGSCAGGKGECVTYYGGANCDSPLGSFKPTCQGNCFQYSSFSSVRAIGSTIPPLGTACTVYSDSNCQNEIADMKNSITSQCASFGQAQSMKCYYNC